MENFKIRILEPTGITASFIELLAASGRAPIQTGSRKKRKSNFLAHDTEKFRGYSDFQLPKEFIKNQSFPMSFLSHPLGKHGPL